MNGGWLGSYHNVGVYPLCGVPVCPTRIAGIIRKIKSGICRDDGGKIKFAAATGRVCKGARFIPHYPKLAYIRLTLSVARLVSENRCGASIVGVGPTRMLRIAIYNYDQDNAT